MKLKTTREIMEKALLMIKQGERAEAEKLLKNLSPIHRPIGSRFKKHLSRSTSLIEIRKNS
ncbi:hypothetical protein JY97_15625 [Alkalispirochaeta odontotermitis]|nr:hypothetical protein JY97_15625 [Alkalispirochaeta odontotermitis]